MREKVQLEKDTFISWIWRRNQMYSQDDIHIIFRRDLDLDAMRKAAQLLIGTYELPDIRIKRMKSPQKEQFML